MVPAITVVAKMKSRIVDTAAVITTAQVRQSTLKRKRKKRKRKRGMEEKPLISTRVQLSVSCSFHFTFCHEKNDFNLSISLRSYFQPTYPTNQSTSQAIKLSTYLPPYLPTYLPSYFPYFFPVDIFVFFHFPLSIPSYLFF